MSDTIIETKQDDTDAVSADDLKRMLEESRTQAREAIVERDTERSRRFQAERQRDEVATHATSEAERRYAAESQSVVSQLAAAETEAERAQEAYATAQEAGDHRAAAAHLRAIAAAEARADRLRNQKEFLETNKERLVRAPVQSQAQPDVDDKYGHIVKGLRPEERAWLDKRPQFLNDPAYQQEVFGASQAANAKFARGTPEYFRRMEAILGENETHAPAERRDEPPPARQPSSDIAPQRRANPGAAPSRNEIRLTADQVEVAETLYGNPSSPDYIADQAGRYQKYHDNLQRLRAQGRV